MKAALLRLAPEDQIQAERRQSRFGGSFQPLPWPAIEWTVRLREQSPLMLQGELVADDAPAFLNFDLAATAFFRVPSPRGTSFSVGECVVREQDRRGRIESVRVRPTEVIVAVNGEQLNATALTLGGVNGQRKKLRRGVREVRFVLAGAIPSGGWLALHQGRELLDRRGIDPAGSPADVEIEVDPITEVEALISNGEGVSTEFKLELPTSEGSIINVMKTVAAFANGAGGTILLGVDDDGSVVGLRMDDRRSTLDRMTQLIIDWVRPHADFDTELVDIDAQHVLLVRVDAGVEPPTELVRRTAKSTTTSDAAGRRFPRLPPMFVRSCELSFLIAGPPRSSSAGSTRD
jgi:schlafen family protein